MGGDTRERDTDKERSSNLWLAAPGGQWWEGREHDVVVGAGEGCGSEQTKAGIPKAERSLVNELHGDRRKKEPALKLA